MMLEMGLAPAADDQKTHPITRALRDQYGEQKYLPPNPVDGREQEIATVQLSSLVEIAEAASPSPSEAHVETKEGKSENKTFGSDVRTDRDLLSLLKKHESALEYFETWHNVTHPVSVSEILGSRSAAHAAKRALIVGPAGTGKTTLLHAIAYQWGAGTLWADKFQGVFWLPLRCLLNLRPHTNERLTVAALLHQECLSREARKTITVENVQEFLDQHKDRILLLLDAYDECAAVVKKEPKPPTINDDVLTKKKKKRLSQVRTVFEDLLETGTVIMTSRPYHLNARVMGRFERRLENRGFNDAQILVYVEDYFKATPAVGSGFKQLLQKQSRLHGMAHVPLNLALLCRLYQKEMREAASDEKKGVHKASSLEKTTTLSGLYQQLTADVIKCYLEERSELPTPSQGPVTVMTHRAAELELLGRLAYLSLTQPEPEIILSPDLLQSISDAYPHQPGLLDSALRLGLLQKVAEEVKNEGGSFLPVDDSQSPHYFIHLSFHEFLAAHYVVESLRYPNTHPRYVEAMRFLRTEKYNPRYVVVFRFVAGLTSLDKTHDRPLLSFWKAMLSKPFDITGMAHTCMIIRHLDETWDDERVPYKKALWEATVMGLKATITGGEFTLYSQSQFIAILKTLKFMAMGLNTAGSFYPQFVYVLWNRIVAELNQTRLVEANPALLSHVIDLRKLNTSLSIGEYAVEAAGVLATKTPSQTITQILIEIVNTSCTGREAAIRALGLLGKRAAGESVIQALLNCNNSHYDTALLAIQALVQIDVHEKTALKLVIPRLNYRNYNYRNYRRLFDDGQMEVIHVDEKTVLKLIIQHLDYHEGRFSAERIESTVRILCQVVEKSTTELFMRALVYLKNRSQYKCREEIRQIVAETIGRLGEKAATEDGTQLLLELVKDEHMSVQTAAIKAFGQWGKAAENPTIVQVLLKLTKKGKLSIKLTAANALDQLGEKEAVESVSQLLLELLESKDHTNLYLVLKAITQCQRMSSISYIERRLITEPMVQLLLEPSPKESCIQDMIVRVLCSLNKVETAIKFIESLLEENWRKERLLIEVVQAAQALGMLEKVATESVIKALLELARKEGKYLIPATNVLFSFPPAAVLSYYLNSSVSLVWGVDSFLSKLLAKILMRSTAVIYIDTPAQGSIGAHDRDFRKELRLYEGQTVYPYSITTRDQEKLVKALLENLKTLAETFLLPTAVQDAYLSGREAFPVVVSDPLPREAMVSAGPGPARPSQELNAIHALGREVQAGHAGIQRQLAQQGTLERAEHKATRRAVAAGNKITRSVVASVGESVQSVGKKADAIFENTQEAKEVLVAVKNKADAILKNTQEIKETLTAVKEKLKELDTLHDNIEAQKKYWQDILAEQKTSGQSLKAVLEQHEKHHKKLIKNLKEVLSHQKTHAKQLHETDDSIKAQEKMLEKLMLGYEAADHQHQFIVKSLSKVEEEAKKNTGRFDHIDRCLSELLEKSQEEKILIQKIEGELASKEISKTPGEEVKREGPVPRSKIAFPDPKLDRFYNLLATELEQFVAAARLVAAGKIDPEQKTFNTGTTIARRAAGLIPVPYAALAVDLLCSAAEAHDKEKKKEEAVTATYLWNDRIITGISEEITRRYQNQIKRLSDKGIEQLATCARKRLMGYMVSLDEKDTRDSAKGDQDKIKLLVRGIIEGNPSNLINTSLETADKNQDENWTAEGLFKRTGIELRDNSGRRYIRSTAQTGFFHRKQPLDSRPVKYGFRFGDADEIKRYGFEELKEPLSPAAAAAATAASNPDPAAHQPTAGPGPGPAASPTVYPPACT